jgi:hypothetical protein
MPFGSGDEYEGGAEESLYVYEKIVVPTVQKVVGGGDPGGVIIERELSKFLPGSIPADIIKNLAEADYVIADITGRNANVYLELGIRYSLRRTGTILMLKDGTGSLPFNVSHYRVVNYSYLPWKELDGREGLENALREAVESRPVGEHPIDSPVFEAFEAHEIGFPNPFRQQDQGRSFQSLVDAKPKLLELCRECFAVDGKIELKYIGMTMFNAWGPLLAILDNLRTSDTSNVSLSVAMLDAQWLRNNRIRRTWTPEQADNFAQQISAYVESHSGLASNGWKVTVRRYTHMPCLHGVLLNDRYLLSGLCRWEGGEMFAGDRSFDLTSVDEDRGRDRVDVFRGWFDYCFRIAQLKSESTARSQRGSRADMDRKEANETRKKGRITRA